MSSVTFDQLVSPLVGGGVAFLIAGIGWIWNLSTRTASVEFLERRISALETDSRARSVRIDDMADRLARIEPMIAMVVEKLIKEA